MSEEDKAIRLYLGDDLLGDEVPIPLGTLIPYEPQIIQYTLRNESHHRIILNDPVAQHSVTLTHPQGYARLTNILPNDLGPSESTPLLVTWLVNRLPKVYGEETIEPAKLVFDIGIVMEE